MEEFLKRFSIHIGDVPDILYHYTTQSGLLGIIQQDEIWMTHTQYLNDSREFHHAVDLAHKVLAEKLASSQNDYERHIWEAMQKSISSGLSTVNICVSCFSENGDSLSQWRAYGGRNGGFSIGYVGSYLKEVAERNQFLMVRCIYDQSEQEHVISQFLDGIFHEIVESPANNKDYESFVQYGGNLISYFLRLAPIFKDSSFSEEQEWRIISTPMSCIGDKFAYRQGNSMIVPYYRLSIASDPTHGPVKAIGKVIIGPTPHKYESLRSVTSLLISHRNAGEALDPPSIQNSAVPYRAW